MKNKLVALSGLALTFVAPVIVFAQQQTGQQFNSCAGVGLGSLEGLLCKIGDLLNLVVPILILLGVVYFVWGVITYVISDDEEAKKKGRDRMIFGIIGLVVIVGLWGLVHLVTNSFGLSNSSTITYPTVPY
jgi:hypothetical protein